ncbi:Glutamyl endopeptidase [Fusarium albosuccineum]|uniref:Glutamyl endopeptidase n=1 Tax=Fusarium albosuccineum TaxID=1237068 RepID=A0A8H4L1E5_9HYPO|nr:Glutamyl endopeptidase [Fusarium albosuccineum]
MTSATPGTVIGCWSLANTNATPAESHLPIGPQADAIETPLADDSRIKVRPGDIQPGGKYYPIVKLQIRYEKQPPSDSRWAQGTGWLIKPDLIVTAGHCAFDHTYNFGKAVRIRAYVGYSGKEFINQKGVQFRTGVKIATPNEWITSDINRANDVSLIQVDKPFNHVDPITYVPTTTFVDNVKLGVVGYPGDKTYKDEAAAEMYEMFKQTTYDLSKTNPNMLEYTISSFGGKDSSSSLRIESANLICCLGQSGSPVIISGENISIGAHVYGLGTKNSASFVRGKYGNYFPEITSAMHSSDPVTTTADGINYFHIQNAFKEQTDELPSTEREAS